MENYDGQHGLETQFQNKVFVHLMRAYTNRRYGKGSELWATLGAGETFADTYSGKTIHVCDIDTSAGTADVSVGDSEDGAKGKCGAAAPPSPPPSPPNMPCLPVDIKTTTGTYASDMSWRIDMGTCAMLVA